MIFKVRTKYCNEEGRPVGKSVIVRKNIPIEYILSIEEVYSRKLKFMKGKSMLICEQPIGNVVVEKRFADMNKIFEDNKQDKKVFVFGFKRYD